MLSAVEAVQAVLSFEEARERVPDHLKKSHPYSALALWTFYLDTHHQPEGESCMYCLMFDGQSFTGSQLRTVFPDHEWEGDDIYANVHRTLWGEKANHTCGCLLVREADPEAQTNLSIWTGLGVDWKEQPKTEKEEEEEEDEE